MEKAAAGGGRAGGSYPAVNDERGVIGQPPHFNDPSNHYKYSQVKWLVHSKRLS